jgi:hypothetical protein
MKNADINIPNIKNKELECERSVYCLIAEISYNIGRLNVSRNKYKINIVTYVDTNISIDIFYNGEKVVDKFVLFGDSDTNVTINSTKNEKLSDALKARLYNKFLYAIKYLFDYVEIESGYMKCDACGDYFFR